MPYTGEKDFRERSFRFTCKLFDFCEEVARTPGPARRLANQLFRPNQIRATAPISDSVGVET